ncbi:MAG TPA: hypothetical protein VHI13_00125 [Candidatus Kapabacteria bacterium]|nr:hypothetical protein [Candidatus Kapabacteria bacterium]
MTTRTIFTALIVAGLATPMLNAQQKATINVSKNQKYLFDVAITTTASMNYTSTMQSVADRSGKPVTTVLGARFVLIPNDVRSTEVDWGHEILTPTYNVTGTDNPFKNLPFTGGAHNFTVGTNGVVASEPVYTLPWGMLAATTLERLGISERHFNQFFFLQSALARHRRGDTWERRHDDTTVIGLLRIRQHYTARFTHEGIVDTLKMKTVRVRFELAIDSIANDLNARNAPSGKRFEPETHDFVDAGSNSPQVESETHDLVHGVIRGVVYYSLRDGMVVAFNSTHTISIRESSTNLISIAGSKEKGNEMHSEGEGKITGMITIARR